jgi:hypothetical protein
MSCPRCIAIRSPFFLHFLPLFRYVKQSKAAVRNDGWSAKQKKTNKQTNKNKKQKKKERKRMKKQIEGHPRAPREHLCPAKFHGKLRAVKGR